MRESARVKNKSKLMPSKETLKHAAYAILAIWVFLAILDYFGQSGIFFYPYTYFTKGSTAANS